MGDVVPGDVLAMARYEQAGSSRTYHIESRTGGHCPGTWPFPSPEIAVATPAGFASNLIIMGMDATFFEASEEENISEFAHHLRTGAKTYTVGNPRGV